MRLKRRIAIVIGGGLLLLIVLGLFFPFRFSSVCTHCGVIRNTTEWQVPLTRITLFSKSNELQTPVSTELVHAGIVTKHDHEWLFCNGGGNGVTCAIGSGRLISPTAQSDGVALILAASQRFGEFQFRDRIMRMMFDSKTSGEVYGLGHRVPKNGFTDKQQFLAWIKEVTEYLDEMVAMQQEG